MFGEVGTFYIYLIYGLHYCVNVVTHQSGLGEAVLIRALQPLEGISLMQGRRHRQEMKELCSGPAKLVQALGITAQVNGQPATAPPLYFIKPLETQLASAVVTSTRVGITKATDQLLRFYLKDNTFVSKV